MSTNPETEGIARLDFARIESGGEVLQFGWADGRGASLPAIWLRHNCRCGACVDPSNAQRLIDITELSADTRIEVARLGDGVLELVFGPDAHASVFGVRWLYDHCFYAHKPQPILWDAKLTDRLPTAQHVEIRNDNEALTRWLACIRDYGFALLHGVASASGEVTRVAELFGHVRETNYGRHFEVKSVVDPSNLAYSSMALGLHTDNPYRDPVPGLQLLHCLENEAEGGDSVLCDGFNAAQHLRAAAPEQFALLTRHAVPFRFADHNTDLRARAPLIELDDEGEVHAVRYNNRSIAAFDLRAEVMADYYAAYRAFAGILQDPAFHIRFKLQAGDLFIVDNRRVLHARTGFASGGKRHLQGCYADMDALLSKLRMLGEKE